MRERERERETDRQTDRQKERLGVLETFWFKIDQKSLIPPIANKFGTHGGIPPQEGTLLFGGGGAVHRI